MKIPKAVYPLSLLLIVAGIWYFFSNVYGVRAIFLPSPQNTLAALWSMLQQAEFWQDLFSSWYRVFIGFLISFLIAYPISIASLLNSKVRDTIFYFVEFFRYLPVPVFIPITILWFGIEDMSKIIIIVLGTFAQMIPMFYDSATAVEKKYASFNFALKWSKLKYIENVVVKGSAPSILDNSRICLGWAWTYLIVAEIVGAEHGIGYAMIRAQRYLATDKIFAYIIVIGLIGILTDRSLVLIRKKSISMEQIKFNDIDLAFGNNVIVESFNLSINTGEIVTFFGPSGCGKSSIMKLVLGINIPSSGSVTIGGLNAAEYKLPISYVPQDNELLPWLSVKDNIEIWSKNAANAALSSTEVLQLVDLSNHSQKLPSMLSGGMSRRTALARGLATRSDILCFDEAMVGIEKTMRHKLLLNLRTYIKKNKATAIFISHDYEETIFLSDRIIVFTPPPTVISKQINVAELSNNSVRDDSFTNSQLFKEVYNQMLTI